MTTKPLDPIADLKKYTGTVLQERRCVGCQETDPAVCAPCYTARYGSPSIKSRPEISEISEHAEETPPCTVTS